MQPELYKQSEDFRLEPEKSRTIKTRLASLLAASNLIKVLPFFTIFCFFGWAYVTVRSNFAWEDADPEILNLAWNMAKGEALYRNITELPYIFNNHTPIYYWLTSLFLKMFGLSYLPSRFISILSAISIIPAFAYLSKEWRGNTRAGIWTACFLLLIPSFLYNVTRTHPQMLCTAFTIWALVFFVRKQFVYSVILSAIFAVLAIYTKQSAIALPIAIGLYLLIHNWKRFIAYSTTILAAGLIPVYFLQKGTNGQFLKNIVGLNFPTYFPGDIAPVMIHHAGPIFLLIGLAMKLCYDRLKAKKWEFVDYYLIVVTLVTLAFCGRIGAHTQYVMEFCSVIFIYLLRVVGFPSLAGRTRLLQYQMLFLMIYAPLYVFVEEGRFGMAANNAAGEVYKILDTKKGDIISQQQSFALFKANRLYVMLGIFGNLARLGSWDQSKLIQNVDQGKVTWVITHFPIDAQTNHPDDIERFTPQLLDAIRKNFKQVAVVKPYYVYQYAER